MNVLQRMKVERTRSVPYETMVVFSRYAEGEHTRIDLIDSRTGEPACVVTVNLPDNPPASKYLVWTKGWAENLGVPRACEKCGLFELLAEYHHIEGTNCMAQLARLSPRAIEQMNAELEA